MNENGLKFSIHFNPFSFAELFVQLTGCLWFLRTNKQFINIINENIEILVLNFISSHL